MFYFTTVKKKGFYIRKATDGSLILNIYKNDFKAFLDELSESEGWVKLRIYEREKESENGFKFNMEGIKQARGDN